MVVTAVILHTSAHFHFQNLHTLFEIFQILLNWKLRSGTESMRYFKIRSYSLLLAHTVMIKFLLCLQQKVKYNVATEMTDWPWLKWLKDQFLRVRRMFCKRQ